MTLPAGSAFLHHEMRKGRGEGDHGPILVNECMEVAERHFSFVVDQEEEVLPLDSVILSLLILSVTST